MRDRLIAFDRSDKGRYAREEALNVLESYTYFVRDFLSNEDYAAVSTEKQRVEISKLLESTRAFMEDSSKVAKAKEEELKEKLKGLKGLVEPIQTRRTEETKRPAMVDRLKESLNQTNQLVDMIREQVKLAEERQSKAKEFTSTPTSDSSDASTDPSPSASDDLDDLEEPDPTSTSTEEEGPKYSDPSDFNAYTSVDLTAITSAYESAKTWLEEKEAEQAKLGPHEEPVLLVREIEKKAEELGTVMRDLLYKKMKGAENLKGKGGGGKKTSKSKSKGKGKKTSSSSASSETETASASEASSSPSGEEGSDDGGRIIDEL